MGNRSRKIVPLTDEQRRFAEEHHDLIYGFLRKKGLAIDEWYDVAAIGFLYAVQDHDFSSGFQFSTYAYRCMSFAISNELQKLKNQNRIIAFNIDTSPTDSSFDLYEKIPSNEISVENRVLSKITAQHVLLQLNAKERTAVCDRAAGLFARETAKREGVSKSVVQSRLTHLRKKLTPIRATL